MQAIHVVYENGIFRPLDPVDPPDRCEVEITVQSQPTVMVRTTLARLAEISRPFPANPELPTDLAAQHDHYLYGLPKQS
jgi:predicted DNA-binding antitoxin AbrB/MazE fold protein